MRKTTDETPNGATKVYWCEEHGVSIWDECCGERGLMGWYQSDGDV
jgi:predicted RNA-binding protein with PUA domain